MLKNNPEFLKPFSSKLEKGGVKFKFEASDGVNKSQVEERHML